MELPTWLILALISPAFWAIVHVLDSYCVEEVFDRSWVGTVTSALTMLLVLPLLCCGLLVTEVAPLPVSAIGICGLCGVAFMAGQLLYFRALSYTESGIVAAYWNMLPLLLLGASYLWLGERLTPAKYAGSGVLVAASTAFCFVDGNLEHRWQSFGLMCLGACCQVVYFLGLKHLFATCPVYPSFLVVTVAMILSGLAPLALPDCRRVFRGNWPQIQPALKFLVLIELANLIAIATSQYAISFGEASLVAAVEAAIPGYTFLVSLGLYAAFRKYGEPDARHRLGTKLLLVGVMMLGVWMVS